MDLKSIKELLNSYGTLVVDNALFENYCYTFTGGWVDAVQISIRRDNIKAVFNSLYQRVLNEVNKIELEH